MLALWIRAPAQTLAVFPRTYAPPPRRPSCEFPLPSCQSFHGLVLTQPTLIPNLEPADHYCLTAR